MERNGAKRSSQLIVMITVSSPFSEAMQLISRVRQTTTSPCTGSLYTKSHRRSRKSPTKLSTSKTSSGRSTRFQKSPNSSPKYKRRRKTNLKQWVLFFSFLSPALVPGWWVFRFRTVHYGQSDYSPHTSAVCLPSEVVSIQWCFKISLNLH